MLLPRAASAAAQSYHGCVGTAQDAHCDAVQEAFKQYPELFSWITAQPDEALVKAFIKYREDLQCVTTCCAA